MLARLEAGAVAPHLVDAEVGQAIRGLVLRGLLVVDDAEASLAAAEELVVERFPHPPLRSRAWQLRSNVSFYDGLMSRSLRLCNFRCSPPTSSWSVRLVLEAV